MISRLGWLKVRDRSAFVRLTGVLFLVYAAQGLWSPLLAVYTKSLGGTTGQIGIVLATFQATALASQYMWGQRSDRLGQRKPLLLIGTAGLAIAYILIASVGQWGWLLAVRLLEGVALAAYNTGSLALIGDLLDDQAGRGRLMSLYRTFGSLAFSIAALSGGLLADNFGIRVPFLVAAGCYALAFALALSIREAAARNAAPAPADDRTQEGEVAHELSVATSVQPSAVPGPRSSFIIWPFLLLTFTWVFAMGSVVSLWPVYMNGLGYSKTEVGGLWALAALGEVPCLLIAGHLADVWGRKRVLLTGVVVMACVYTAYTLSSAGLWMAGVQIVRSFAYSCVEAPSLVYATELGLRQQRGRLAGLYYSATGAGSISGSLIGGAVAGQVGLPLMYRGVVVVMLVVAVIVGKTMPRLRPNEHAAPQRSVETQRV